MGCPILNLHRYKTLGFIFEKSKISVLIGYQGGFRT
jgi:hypothetical protein